MSSSRNVKRSWVKLWINECLRGSIRVELSPDERGVWYDLLLMAGDSRTPGIIQATEGVPYPRELIAGWLNVPLELLEGTIQKCIATGRIIDNHGTLHIVNWEKYQAHYERRKEEKEEKMVLPSFAELKKQLEKANNKVGFLIDAFKSLHPHAPKEDFEVLGSRMAGIWKLCYQDSGYLLKLIWESSTASIAGSHLNYIQGILKKDEKHKRSRRALPEEYTPGPEYDA